MNQILVPYQKRNEENCIARFEPGTFGFLTKIAKHLVLSYMRSLEISLSPLALVADVVWRMLKTRVTRGNISRVLLNLIKRLMFVMFKDSYPLLMFRQ